GTVRRPSINAQASERFIFTKNRARKVFLGHEISPQLNSILRATVVDALPTRFRHSKQLQIPRLPTRIGLPRVLVMHRSPEKRSPLLRLQGAGRFWTKARVKSRSTKKTSRSRSSRCASC